MAILSFTYSLARDLHCNGSMDNATCMNKKDNMYCYVITCVLNGRQYVGITKTPRQRWNTHCSKSADSYISRAIRKYGKENFRFNLISEGTPEQIKATEIRLISFLGTLRPSGYNILEGGDFLCRMPGSENPRAEAVTVNDKQYGCIKDAAKDLGINPETLRRRFRRCGSNFRYERYDADRRAGHQLGRKHTPETIQKLKKCVKPTLGRHQMAKAVEVNGHKYTSIKEAAIAENINYSTLRWRLQELQKGKLPTGKTKAKPLIIEGTQYLSITSAAKSLGVSPATLAERVRKWERTGKWPSGYKFYETDSFAKGA